MAREREVGVTLDEFTSGVGDTVRLLDAAREFMDTPWFARKAILVQPQFTQQPKSMIAARTQEVAPLSALKQILTHPATISNESVQLFRELRDQWRRETHISSSGSEMIIHPAYLSIIGMGRPAVPILLRELKDDPDYWFAALEAITRENPVDPTDKGDLDAMAQAWLKWGDVKGYVI